jgi:aquaporin Z
MKKYIAEFIGTFCLVFSGTGAIVVNDITNGTITHTGVALTFGMIVTAMIYAIGDISGAHINPAVTIGFWAARKLSGEDVMPYIMSQCAGALLASVFLMVLFAEHQTLGATMPSGAAIQSFFMEFFLTFMLMFVILNVSTDAKETGVTAGIAVGSTVALAALFGGPISGASMNPARSLAPALVSGNLDTLWIYLSAPVLGSYAAVLIFRFVR